MNPDLINAINRLADAHAKLADNVGRLADSFTHVEGRYEKHSFADALVWRLEQVSSSIDSVAGMMPEPTRNED